MRIRKIAFWPILFVLMALMLALTAGLALAQLAPFHPGDGLFPLQHDAELLLVNLTANPGDRAMTCWNAAPPIWNLSKPASVLNPISTPL